MEPEMHPAIERVVRHPLLAHVARVLEARAPSVIPLEEEARRAAVAFVLRVGDADTPELLMIKRAAYEGDPWSGHVALPGGRHEGDEPLERTAIRETFEETALDLARDALLLGRLDDVQPRSVVRPRLVISPYVFAYAGTATPVLGPEVAEAFWVPVPALQDPAASREIVLELSGAPRRVQSFQHGGHTIWGLTERMLRQFLEVLEGQGAGSRKQEAG